MRCKWCSEDMGSVLGVECVSCLEKSEEVVELDI